MTTRSLLIINYQSASLAAEAIRTARASSSQPLQAVVVDNSVDPAEAEALRLAADIVIAAPRNLGYAGGINAGRRACDGDTIIVSNPDVCFGRDAVDKLVDVDASVAGPALFWDDGQAWMLPPAELHTPGEVASRTFASRSHAWAQVRDRRRFLARVAFWSLTHPTRVRALSGAVLAIRASALDGAGGFDERFTLYFEENDFLRRVRGGIVYVPEARCRHLYNQSAGGSAQAAALYEESELRYLRKWGGAFARRFEKGRPEAGLPSTRIGSPQSGARSDGIVIEASPLATFETAAGCFTNDRRAGVPDDVWRAYRGEALYFRAVERATGRILDSWAKARIPV